MWNASRFCVSSLRRGHANLLCAVVRWEEDLAPVGTAPQSVHVLNNPASFGTLTPAPPPTRADWVGGFDSGQRSFPDKGAAVERRTPCYFTLHTNSHVGRQGHKPIRSLDCLDGKGVKANNHGDNRSRPRRSALCCASTGSNSVFH